MPENISEEFNQVHIAVRDGNVDIDPNQQQKLKLYALYKQATEGDVTGEKPGFTDFVARTKFSAWELLRGMDKEVAMAEYVRLVKTNFAEQ